MYRHHFKAIDFLGPIASTTDFRVPFPGSEVSVGRKFHECFLDKFTAIASLSGGSGGGTGPPPLSFYQVTPNPFDPAKLDFILITTTNSTQVLQGSLVTSDQVDLQKHRIYLVFKP